MKRNHKSSFLPGLVVLAMSTLVVLICGTVALAQKPQAAVNAVPAGTQQPLYTDYKGVRLGMTPAEARSKLGKAAYSDKELDYFILSETETVQIGYDTNGKVKAISIDYLNGTGAPDPKAVVGADLETRENGSRYRIVYYDAQGFSVAYNRTAGPVAIVTITITKMWSPS